MTSRPSATVSTAADPVQATTLAGGAPVVQDLSMWGLFLHADWVVKFIILALVMMSFWSWAIIIEKHMVMKKARARAKTFENEFWAAEALDKFHERVKKRPNHPLAILFVAAMDEWFRSKSAAVAVHTDAIRIGIRERINAVMQVTRNRELERLENGLSFLATAGSSAPFIGLFGTVWGIMNSFHAIALSKNTSLAAVAPGIAEALFATAIGLLAAIPAYIAYNKFTHDIGMYAGKLEDFSTEFDTILSRQMETQVARAA